MNFWACVEQCHVRSGVYRRSKPATVYWKNHEQSIASRVPDADQLWDDWEEYDPRDDSDCSLEFDID